MKLSFSMQVMSLSEWNLRRGWGMATVRPVNVVARMAAARADLGLSGEGLGLRGGGVRGTAGFGAMLAAGRRPWMMCLNCLLRPLWNPRSILAAEGGQTPTGLPSRSQSQGPLSKVWLLQLALPQTPILLKGLSNNHVYR